MRKVCGKNSGKQNCWFDVKNKINNRSTKIVRLKPCHYATNYKKNHLIEIFNYRSPNYAMKLLMTRLPPPNRISFAEEKVPLRS